MPQAIAVLSFSVELNATEPAAPIQLLPAGAFRARDGRPTECPAWICTAADAQRVIELANADQRLIVIDYEHQTLNAPDNGQPAPAAGWFKTMEWREGVGLFATDVEWTDKARQMIADKEYRYLSPVFAYDKKTGDVLRILHVALTNFPALDDLPEVALRAAAHFQLDQFLENDMPEWLKQLLIKLGIDPDNEQAATAALTALHNSAQANAAKDTEIAALRAQVATAGSPDPAKFVPVETMRALQSEVAALTEKVNGREVEDVIEAARKAGKLLEAQVQWARDLGTKDIAALRTFVASAPAVAALSGMQTAGKAPNAAAGQDGLTEAELAVCKTMGYTPEQFKKTKTATAA
ncbi:phage protease [Ralstonia mannitolilytica]|uniref:phage protease n=1 Tax=Ralstonia mannitolilytica TaxID=105219 RepID=UPI0014256B17|nr:phage protease [Ralstonia mannitolilytica]